MTINKLFIVVLGCFYFLVSCKKQTITTHENLIIEGNTPPPYDGISSTQIEIYVNKLHIDLLGIQVSDSDLAIYTQYLKNQNLTETARDSVIDVLMAKPEYYQRLFTILSGRLLENLTEFELQDQINTYAFIADQLYLTGDTINAQAIEYENSKLITLQKSDSLYQAGAINVNQFYAAFCNNSVYDEINMGSLNFAISCFENYLFRSPSTLESTNGSEMIDGQSRILLQNDGNSKLDFITIVTNSDEFYQGLVIENFTSYLSRQPSSYEMYSYTQVVKTANNLNLLKKNILHSDEYAGF